MKARYILDATRPSLPIELNAWTADIMLVSNPTGSPVAIRLGGNDIPSATNYDELCAGGGYLEIPVSGAAFAVAFTQPSLATTASSSNLGTRCSVTLLSKDEAVPNFGAASFQSLSTSELFPITAISGTGVLPILDLGAWGGALVYVAPTSASGQAILSINASDDGINFAATPVGVFALWPNVPAIIQVPRVARYLLVRVDPTAVPGEPSIAYSIAVRATLNEIQQLVYNVGSQPIQKTFSLSGIASQQYSFVTAGLPAVSIASIATVGTTSGAAMQFLVEASADFLNWRQVTSREQSNAQGVTLYRSVGQLDFWTRITFFQEVAGQTLNASAYFSVPPVADLAYILNTIQQSLGDRFQSSAAPARADIYHELEAIYQALGPGPLTNYLNTLVTIENNNNGQLINLNTAIGAGNLTTILNAVNTALGAGNLTNILNTILSLDNSIAGSTSTSATNSGTIATNTGTSATNSTAIATNTSNTATNTSNTATVLNNNSLRTSRVICVAANITGGGTYISVGALLNANEYIVSATAGIQLSVAGPGTNIQMSIGIAAATIPFYLTFASNGNAASFDHQGPEIQYTGPRSAGLQVGSNTTLFIAVGNTGTVFATIVVSS